MSNYVESATLIVLDEASKPVNKITKELRALARAAATLKDAFKTNNSSDKLNVLSRTMDTAARQAGKMRAELSGVNAELSKMASLGLRVGRGGGIGATGGARNAGIAQAELARIAARAQIDITRDAAAAQVRAEREAVAAKRESAHQTEAVARASGAAQIDIARDVARAQTQAEKEVAAMRREAASESKSAAQSQAQALRLEAREAKNTERAMNRLANEEARRTKAARAEAEASRRENVRGFFHGSHMLPVQLLAAGGGAYGAGRMVHALAEDTGERAQETYLQRERGFSNANQFQFRRAAEGLSDKYSSVTNTEALRMLRESSDKVHDASTAISIADIDARNFQNMDRLTGGNEAESANNVTTLRKAAEVSGKLTDISGHATPDAYKEFSNTIMRVMVAEGRAFDANQALQTARMLKSSGVAFTPEGFMESYFLGADAGGGRAGNAINQMVKGLTGRATKEAMKLQSEIGLIDADVEMGKNGTVKRVHYNNTPDEELLRTNSLAYIEKDILGPDGALAKFAKTPYAKGLDFTRPDDLPENATPEERAVYDGKVNKLKIAMGKFAQAIGSNQNAADAIVKLMTQDKEMRNKLAKAMGIRLEDEDVFNAKNESLHAAVSNAKARSNDALANIGESFVPVVIPALNMFADAVKGASTRITSITDSIFGDSNVKFPGIGPNLPRTNAQRALPAFETGVAIGGAGLAAWGIKNLLGKGLGSLFRGVQGTADTVEGLSMRASADPLTRSAGALMEAAGDLTRAAGSMNGIGKGLPSGVVAPGGGPAGMSPLMLGAGFVGIAAWIGEAIREDLPTIDGIKGMFGGRTPEQKKADDDILASPSLVDGKTVRQLQDDSRAAVEGFLKGLLTFGNAAPAAHDLSAAEIERMRQHDIAERNRNAPENSPEAKRGAALSKLPIEEISAAIERTSAGLGSLADPAEHAGSALATIPGTAAAFNGALGSMIERMNSANINVTATVSAPPASTGGMPAPHG
jgi:hypothetical protein